MRAVANDSIAMPVAGTLDRTLSDALYFADPPSLWAVQVDFAPPPPVGLRLPVKWITNDCETGCVGYTVGSAPPLRWDLKRARHLQPTGALGRQLSDGGVAQGETTYPPSRLRVRIGLRLGASDKAR